MKSRQIDGQFKVFSLKMSTNRRVIMKTSDGGQTTFTRDESRQSGLITDMIQNLGMNESNEDVIVPMDGTDITKETLQKIVEWTKKFADHESRVSIDKPADQTASIDVESEAEIFPETSTCLQVPWQREFIANLDSDQIYHVLTAANYLQHESLLDAITSYIAHMLRGKTSEEIRAMVGMEEDFNPEEFEAITKENIFLAD
ncbi:Skp1-related protein [Aphelenchoides besseyi]|nr:Skp1-related protein [Aphelenchoides besseyi]